MAIENKICQELAILKAAGVKNALCPDLGAVQIARAAGLEPYGDFGLNVFNSRTAHLLPHPLASFELRQEDVNRLAANGNDVGALVYGHLPLMLTRNCPVQAHIGCAACQKQGRLTDRKGCTFPRGVQSLRLHPTAQRRTALYGRPYARNAHRLCTFFIFLLKVSNRYSRCWICSLPGKNPISPTPEDCISEVRYDNLSSNSPRRRELLAHITRDFTVQGTDVDESLPAGIAPAAAVEQLSLRKALPLNNGAQIVIGADTVVAVDGMILGKPADEAEARQMLARLSGRWHSVFTRREPGTGRTASDFLLRDPSALL